MNKTLNFKGQHLVLAIDGACLGNPGPGAWAVVARDYDGEAVVSRYAFAGRADGTTTNNQMEMTAAIQALQFARNSRDYPLTIISDSQYVIKGVTEYLPSWKARGWRKSDGKKVLNRELWEELDEARQGLEVHWQWTRGHDGHELNELADKIANDVAAGINGGGLDGLRQMDPEAFSW
jgi:ribonuclease HI